MSKNKKVMSLAIRPELHDEIKDLAKRKGQSASTYIGNLLEQAVKLNPDDDVMVVSKPIDEEIIPCLLRIPIVLKSNPERFKQWLDVQTAGIIKAMTKQTVA